LHVLSLQRIQGQTLRDKLFKRGGVCQVWFSSGETADPY
jgi:hypothetical protein